MLPVAESGVEDQVDKFFGDFVAELVLHVGEHFGAVEVAVGAERLVDVLAFGLVVDVADLDLNGQAGA